MANSKRPDPEVVGRALADCYLLLLKLAAEERIKRQKTSVNRKIKYGEQDHV